MPHGSPVRSAGGLLAGDADAALVIDLSVYACTDSTCRPGGRPVANRYRIGDSVATAELAMTSDGTSRRAVEARPHGLLQRCNCDLGVYLER